MSKSDYISENSVSFLLAQFEESRDGEKRMESLIDREIQYYFALGGGAIAAGGLIVQAQAGTLLIVSVIHLFVLILVLAGYRLLRRLVVASGMIAVYSAQIGLIRRVFADSDPSLINYTILPIASEDLPAHPFVLVSKQLSMRLVENRQLS